jgi:hypothetical protein
MPRLLRTVLPRIRRSLAERGLLCTVLRAPILPLHLVREHRNASELAAHAGRSDFDLRYGVETDGDVGGDRTFLSDLEIPSANWIYGKDYSAIAPDRFFGVLSSFRLNWEEFAFVDLGSGKGRALLLATEFPFQKIVGIEFAPALHAVALRNIQSYSSPTQRCKSVQSICMDFTEFRLPAEPCLVYLFDPCREKTLEKTLHNVHMSWREHPRRIVLVYVSPVHERVFDSAAFLRKLPTSAEYWYRAYEISETT